MKASIKMIIMDLDGTLLMDDDKSVSEGNLAALRKAAARQICVVAATGRSYVTVPDSVKKMRELSYIVTSNGAVVTEMGDNPKIIRQTYLAPSIIKTVMSIAGLSDQKTEGKGSRIIYEAFLQGRAYTDADYYEDPIRFGSNPKEMNYIRSTRIPTADMTAFIAGHIHELDSISLICHEPDRKIQLAEAIKRAAPEIEICDSAPRLLEFSNPGCSKWSAIEFLMEKEAISRAETIAFGDSGNDLEMVKSAGIGVCMGDGKESLKAAADYITKACMQDGVAYALYDLGIV